MDEKVNPETPPNPVAGRLEGISVPDLLWNLCSKNRTGVLCLSDPNGIEKNVYIERGEIVFAASSDPNERLGDLLLRRGEITLDQFDHATSQLATGKRLGTILVESGYLSPERLVRGVIAQVQDIVLGLFAWTEGEYRFAEGPLPTAEVVTLNMRTGEILLQGIRHIRAFARIRRSVGPSRTTFRMAPDAEDRLRGLTLTDGERALLGALGDRGRTVGDLCREVFLSNFEIYQALWGFRVLGAIREVEHPSDAPQGEVTEGRFDADGLAGVLLRLAKAGETGVLHVSRRAQERSFQFREGRCVFATSNDIDDGLMAHLLRRGVVSLRDRDETAKRLLSNKRAGKILLEMGVIDAGDLQRLVREQLLEIFCDTFRWEDAEWVFQAGELPTIEEITLDASIEDLVASGVRRVDSWPRVREGCGGLSARLCLTPSYLAVLDRMQAGDSEWEVVARLRTPSSVMDICRGTTAGDFRVCQSLWTLRLLGAVAAAPVEARVEPEAMDMPAAAAIPDPAPIVPVAMPEGAAYELTGADDMTPESPHGTEETAAAAIAPSSWSEPADELSVPWTPTPDSPGLTVAAAPSGGGELITEPWRLAADRPAAEVAVASVEPVTAPAEDPATPPLDEPTSATRYIPRDEVDLAVSSNPEAPGFEIDDAAARAADPSPVIDALAADMTIPIPAEHIPPPVEEAPWVPPADLDPAIARFNGRHKIVWRVIRSEVGAGAANFVRSCRNGLGERFHGLLEGTELQPDGTFDPAAVRRSVAEQRIEDAAAGLDRLLEQELGQLALYLGEKRAQALREQVDAIQAPPQTARPPE